MARKREVGRLEARRFEAARRFARGESQAVVARALDVTPMTACRWYQTWARKGRAGLKAAGRLGRKPRLDHRQLARIDLALRRGPMAHGFATDLWTLPRIAEVIERQTGQRFHPGHVWRLLRSLNWSLQRPARQAVERDEDAIRRWVQVRWPAVKKTPAANGPGSSSRTKAGFPSSPSSGGPGRRAARPPS
jgi:transposase